METLNMIFKRNTFCFTYFLFCLFFFSFMVDLHSDGNKLITDNLNAINVLAV